MKIFISYASSDYSTVSELAQLLESLGVEHFQDRRTFTGEIALQPE